MNLSTRERKILWTRAGNFCSFRYENQVCKQLLSETIGTEPVVIGEECHIIGEKPCAARYLEDYPQRESYLNAILLCPAHHKIIDDQKTRDIFSVEFLRDMKKAHEEVISKNNSADKEINAKLELAIRKYPKNLVDIEINKQLSSIRRSRFLGKYSVAENSIRLSERITCGELEGGSDDIKSTALSWCARFLAIGEYHTKANELLSIAKKIGNGPEITIAEAFIISSEGDLDKALGKLSIITSPAARSAALMIITNKKGPDSAIDWLTSSEISMSELDADGKYSLISLMFELGKWEMAHEYANILKYEDYEQAPALFHIAALANLEMVIADELRSSVIHYMPFMVRTFPLDSTEDALQFRRKAQELFYAGAVIAKELGCAEAANVSEEYALWLELRDPENFNSGLQKLKESMKDPAYSLRRIPFALQFGLNINLIEVEKEIERQTTLSGGNSPDTAIARLSIAFTKDTPKAKADYIEQHSAQLIKHLDKMFVISFEIEMLSAAGLQQKAEKRLLDLINEGLPENEQLRLREIIEKSDVANEIKHLVTQFNNTGKISDLANLVYSLEKQQDWQGLCYYGYKLFELTHDLSDIERLIRALDSTGRHNEIIELLRMYPEFIDQSDILAMLLSWSYYYEGLFINSTKTIEKLKKKRNHQNDRGLSANLAIASGAWEALMPYIEEEWNNRDYRNAGDLIHTAQIAQQVKSPRAKDLVCDAATKGSDDANILVAAYMLATNAGWENESIVADWFKKASELSNKDGPLKKMSLKDLVDKKPEWDRLETEFWKQLNAGNVPICGAALLNRTLVDMILLPALANPTEQDLRKRALVPAYSGSRCVNPNNYYNIAIEPAALLTLGCLDLLEIVRDTFESITIPHSTLWWLFEEKQKVVFHQPSKIKDALNLRQLLACGELKVFTPSTSINSDLANEIGVTLASFITELHSNEHTDGKKRFIIRSAPVHRISSLMEEEADLSPYYCFLCSCLSVVNKLKQKGRLTESEERCACEYLCMREKQWPSQPEISDRAILYLDELSISYLQHTGLLAKLHSAGLEAYIPAREFDEVNALINYDQLSSKVSIILENIRIFLSSGIQTGKIKVGRISYLNKVEDQVLKQHPTMTIFEITKEVDAIVVDDRFINQHPSIADDTKNTPIITTFDLIHTLHAKDTITLEKVYDFRTNLRRAGYIFIPITYEELQHYLSISPIENGHINEIAELKVIREYILRIQMSKYLNLPQEAPWLESLLQTLLFTLKAQWRLEIDEITASIRSEWLLKLLDIRCWAQFYKGENERNIMEYIYSAQILALILTSTDLTDEIKGKYGEWIEKHILEKIKYEDSELYSLIMIRVQEIISHIANEGVPEEMN